MSRRVRHDWFLSRLHAGRRQASTRLATINSFPLHRRLRIEPLEDRRLLALVTVNTLNDTVDFSDGVTSLREAIFATNLVGGADTIDFAPSLTVGGPATITLTQGELAITGSLTINGSGANLLTIDASGNDPTPDENNGDGSRVFNIDDGSTTKINVLISGVTLTGGDVNGVGGAIRGFENVTIGDSTIRDNSATTRGGGLYIATANLIVNSSVISGNSTAGPLASSGGGIYQAGSGITLTITGSTIVGNWTDRSNGGGIAFITANTSGVSAMTVTDSTIRDNLANNVGGGIRFSANSATSLTIVQSTIIGNSANEGGGIYEDSGSVSVIDSTISNNLATGLSGSGSGYGGGILNRSFLTIAGCTISGNWAARYGGGLEGANVSVTRSTFTNNSAGLDGGGLRSSGMPILSHTIVAGNTRLAGEANDVSGLVTSAFSLLGVDTGATIVDNGGSLIGTAAAPIDPLLGPLADNGGPTKTRALLSGSPAINRGDLSAVAGMNGVSEFDQRGAPFGRVFNGRIDIGAFEYQAASDLNLVVDTLADESDGNYALGDLSLREALLLANTYPSTDTIRFAPALAGGTILLTMGELTIADNTSIDGLGADLLTIDASGNDPTPDVNNGDGSRIFNIDDHTSSLRTVSISGLTLAGGDASGPGGAIFAAENLTVSDSVITGNATTSGLGAGGGGIYSRAAAGPVNMLTVLRSSITGNAATNFEGGGIRKRFGKLTIDASTISGNSALEAGGGVSATEDLTVAISNSTISDNHATGASTPFDGGGGIFLFRATTTITGSTISGNTGIDGGGIYNYRGFLLVVGSTISGNSTTNGDGGGISNRYANVTLRESTVSGNMALSTEAYPYTHGGGIYTRGYSNNSFVVRASTIEGNSAVHGGGIWKRSGTLTVTDSIVRGNSAAVRGGGISSFYGNLTLTRSTVEENDGGSFGGGVSCISGSAILTGSTIRNNDVIGYGGGLFVNGSLTVSGSTISGNSANGSGGGIRSYGGNLGISGSTISGNSAGANGGGIHRTSAATITDSTINDNSAVRGGAIYFGHGDATLSIIGGTISGNSAQEGGGGIYNRATLSLVNSTVSDNSAGTSGGGVYATYGAKRVTLTSSTISGNAAIAQGGGLYLKDSYTNFESLTVTDSTISGNSARGTGGGISFRSGGTMTVVGSTLSGNTTAGGGGGVYLLGKATTMAALRHSTIAFNSAGGLGGGLSAFGGTLTLDHSLLATNTATFGPDLISFFGTFSARYSLIGSNVGTALTEAPVGLPDGNGNLIGGPTGGVINPQLGLLADNGGPTFTHALLLGSPALEAGDPNAIAGTGTVPQYDQRGAPFVRVFDADVVGGARIDIGAYERQTVPGLSLVVSTLVDESDGNYLSGDLALRETLGLARGSIGANTITFAGALTAGGPATIRLTRGELVIADAVSIQGPGPNRLTIDASGNDPTPDSTFNDGDFYNEADGSRVFNVDDNMPALQTVSISGLRLTGGDTDLLGGGVFNREDLTIADSIISGNSTISGFTSGGGGIFSYGNLIVSGSVISDNSTFGSGGGIRSRYGAVVVTASTISGNLAGGVGGGGIAASYGTLSVTNSTISGNSAGEWGGGIWANLDFAAPIVSSTIAYNSAGTYGGGIFVGFASPVLNRAIVAKNTRGNNEANDVTGNVTAAFSLIGVSPDGTVFDNGGNLVGTAAAPIDPLLGPLAENGGPTRTHALLAGSPAIDRGQPGLVPGSGGVPLYDQRGMPFTRVYDGGSGPVGAQIDIGAFELQPMPAAFSGDYNVNSVVDAADYVLWRKTRGQTGLTPYSGADGSGDGTTNDDDYGVWRANFGKTLPPPGAGSGDSNATASAALFAPVGDTQLAAASPSFSTSEPNQIVVLPGTTGDKRAASQRENPPPVIASTSSPFAPYRPADRGSLDARQTFDVSRHDEALVAWLSLQPDTKEQGNDFDAAETCASEDVSNGTDDVHIDSVEQVFALLASN